MPEPYRFSWVDKPWLAAMAYPDSVDDLQWLRAQGLQVLLSLTEQPVRRDWTNEAGLLVVHVPVEDFGAPSPEQLDLCLASINRARANEMGVTVHCAAGMGRTGTILAAYFVGQGKSAMDAIRLVRDIRPGSIETNEQLKAITELSYRLRGS